MDSIQKARELIRKNRLIEAITLLLKLSTRYNDSLSGYQTKLTEIEEQELDFIITHSEASSGRSKVTRALLKVVSKIEEEMEGDVGGGNGSVGAIGVNNEEVLEKIIGRNGL